MEATWGWLLGVAGMAWWELAIALSASAISVFALACAYRGVRERGHRDRPIARPR